MTYTPLFDPTGLSDEQIDDKIAEINQKLLIVNSASGNVSLMDQLANLRLQLQEEQIDRATKKYEQNDRGTSMVTGGYPKVEKKKGKKNG